jgi:glycosyltransferase involved in cell wall biosynthesis
MKILFLTLARIESIESQGIYTDLIRKFRDNGHDITVVFPSERKYQKPTHYVYKEGVRILSVWSTNIQKTNLIEKGITTLLLEFYFYFAIRKYLPYRDFDLILYSTPPITLTNIIKRLKRISNAKTYLLLKDIFPQNAIDLKLLKHSSFLYKYFRAKEKVLYDISDFIGCMSKANVSYILNNNPEIEKSKVEVNPNSIEVKSIISQPNSKLYEKYNIPNDKVIFIFGGNLGKPQGIEFLKKHIVHCSSIKEAFFLIVGAGTEYNEFDQWIKKELVYNVCLINELPKDEYDDIIKLSDVGLVFLNPNFTIPNFPSRLLSYMQNRLPVICATDINTDIGIIAKENNFGFTCLTSDEILFKSYVIELMNKNIRQKMGNNAFEFLLQEYNVNNSYQIIIEKFKKSE